ncbi:MAG: DUF5655 domain-containing protein [Acidimicrobiia bacterium]
MAGWTCPDCSRLFARQGQTHECEPAMSLEEYFSTGPARERPIFESVLGHLEALGPMHVEPVSVGIFIKSTGSFVELRPMTRWVALWFPMAREIAHSRIARKPVRSGRRIYHVVNLFEPDDVDDQVREWLTESYADFG